MKLHLFNKSFVYVTVALVGMAYAIPANAGEWKIDGLKVTAEYKGGNNIYSGNNYFKAEYLWNKSYENLQGGGSKTPDNINAVDSSTGIFWNINSTKARLSMSADRYLGKVGGPTHAVPSYKTIIQFTVAPKFVWVPRRINPSAENNYAGVIDLEDKPGILYYWDSYELSANNSWTRYQGQNGNLAQNIENILIKNKFGSSRDEYTSPEKSSVPGQSSLYLTSKDKKVSRIDTEGKQEVYGDSITVSANLQWPAFTTSNSLTEDKITSFMSGVYNVELISFQLSSRLKEGHTLQELSGFEAVSNIAAGGLNNGGHKADVMVEVKRTDNTKIEGFLGTLLPKLHFDNTEYLYRKPKVDTLRGFATDANGQMIIGEATSGDAVNPSTKVPYVYFERLSNSPATSINHIWTDGQWSMGEQGEEPWKPKFTLITSDWVKRVYVRLNRLKERNIAIDPVLMEDHEMDFGLKKLIVKKNVKINPNSDEEDYKLETDVYTTNPNEEVAEGENRKVYLGPSLPKSLTDLYVSFSTAEMTVEGFFSGGPGGDPNVIYRSTMTVKKSPDFEVVNFDPVLVDQGTYHKKVNP